MDFNEFWQPPVFNISKNDKHDEMQPFGKLKTLLRATLMFQIVLMYLCTLSWNLF